MSEEKINNEKQKGGEEMNHVNYIFRGSCIKFFPESSRLSERRIITDGTKNTLGDVKNNGVYNKP